MADFTKALHRTSTYEGGYVFDPDDRGGETFRGISRVNHPKWQGWTLVDDYKKKYPKTFRQGVVKDVALVALSSNFYRYNFWNAMRGDEIKSQALAEEIFDMSVNAGLSAGVKMAQRVCSLPQTGKMDDSLIDSLNRRHWDPIDNNLS